MRDSQRGEFLVYLISPFGSSWNERPTFKKQSLNYSFHAKIAIENVRVSKFQRPFFRWLFLAPQLTHFHLYIRSIDFFDEMELCLMCRCLHHHIDVPVFIILKMFEYGRTSIHHRIWEGKKYQKTEFLLKKGSQTQSIAFWTKSNIFLVACNNDAKSGVSFGVCKNQDSTDACPSHYFQLWNFKS